MGPLYAASVLGSVWISSVAGSLHCVGMCGGFALWARHRNGTVAYHLGRLIGYAFLGTLAGAFGNAIMPLPDSITIGIDLAIGGLLVVSGLSGIIQARRQRKSQSTVAQVYSSAVSKIVRQLDAYPQLQSGAIGICSVWLPCGWLYSFFLLALQHSPPMAIGIMTAFWAGTLPAMVTGSWILHQLSGSFKSRLYLIQPIIITLIGLITIGLKLNLILSQTSCH